MCSVGGGAAQQTMTQPIAQKWAACTLGVVQGGDGAVKGRTHTNRSAKVSIAPEQSSFPTDRTVEGQSFLR